MFWSTVTPPPPDGTRTTLEPQANLRTCVHKAISGDSCVSEHKNTYKVTVHHTKCHEGTEGGNTGTDVLFL